MKFFIIFLITILTFTSCWQTETKTNSIIDTTQKATSSLPADSLQYLKDSIDNAEPDLKQQREEYINDYAKTEIIDTTFKDKNGNEIKVVSKYYCLFDSKIVVPKIFVWEDTTKTFTTHNFANDIKIIINKSTVFNKTITKRLFENDIEDESQKKYAVLFSPNFHFDNEREVFIFNYSLSIPLTDLGTGRCIEIDKAGVLTKRY